MEKKTENKIKRRQRFSAVRRFLLFLIPVVLVAEHFYRDEFKAFFKEHDIPVYEFCASFGDGSWFDKEKTPLGKGVGSPTGQVNHAKDLINKRTGMANDIINESSKE